MADAIMAHLVAYFPDESASYDVARALVDGGCSYLEVQFPFSDPTADGVVIQRACAEALAQGFRVQSGFDLLARIRQLTDIPIFVMSYANLVVTRGIERFLAACREVGMQGVIVPDLPPDYDEGLFAAARRSSLEAIPVVAPTITDARLELCRRTGSRYLYAALRTGITGQLTELGEENTRFLCRVAAGGVQVLAGFGIQERRQIVALSSYVQASVVGSAFVSEILNRGNRDVYDVVRDKMTELCGRGEED